MMRIHFSSEDLRRITVADQVDPMWEVLLSLHLLQDRPRSLIFGDWCRRVRSTLPSKSARMLAEIAPSWGYSPDFLTPGRGDADFGSELDQVLSTSRSRLSEDFTTMGDERPLTQWTKSLAAGESGAMRQLGGLLGLYHRTALAPYHKRIQVQVESDRERRARAVLAGGVDDLLGGLHPRLIWEPPVLSMPVYANTDIRLDGRGLVLVPSFFCRIQPITVANGEMSPVLVYPLCPRLGWHRSEPTGHDEVPVFALMGRTRAKVLESVVDTATTSELASRLRLAVPVVSRHCTVLRGAGLLGSHREGGSVLHGITALGIAVLNGELPT